MARRKKGIDALNETLSTENPEIQEELLKDLVDNKDNEDRQVSNENNDMNNLSNEPVEENVEEPGNIPIEAGDRVKINRGTNTDTMGRRIHNGLQNYTYTVRSVRPDGIACIECLTHVFNVKLTDITKI